MGWHERIVYHRDFALDARRSRMANGSISHLPAGTFAEYVVDRVRVETKWQRDRLLSGPTIDVYVGPSQRHWALHRNLLCHHSERLNDELQAGQAATLYLADYDPAGFELLVTWLYQGRLDNVSDKADAAQKYDYAVACHKLYLLCHRLAMLPLSNLAIDQYRNALHQAQLVPDPDEINDIYRTSPAASSPFRRLVTRIAARQIMDPNADPVVVVDSYRPCFENNPDFALDLVKVIRTATGGGFLLDDPTDTAAAATTTANGCEYHDHHEAEPHCSTQAQWQC